MTLLPEEYNPKLFHIGINEPLRFYDSYCVGEHHGVVM